MVTSWNKASSALEVGRGAQRRAAHRSSWEEEDGEVGPSRNQQSAACSPDRVAVNQAWEPIRAIAFTLNQRKTTRIFIFFIENVKNEVRATETHREVCGSTTALHSCWTRCPDVNVTVVFSCLSPAS